jgi:hypothetical protein
MANDKTLFDVPLIPDEFGVVLPSPSLRRIDFSGLDYPTSRRAIIEYIRTYYPNDFNDFVASNGIMMLIEIVSSVVAKLSLRGDMLANESTLPTATTEEAVINHLALINQRIKRQTPAISDIEITVDTPIFTDIEIDPGAVFSTVGTDGDPVFYEVYRSPGDWTSKIIIPANKRGVIGYGIEGKFGNPTTVISGGGPNQRFVINEANILEAPIFVYVKVGGSTEEYKVVAEPIERYGPTDKVVEVNFVENQAIFRFGDDVTGAAPLSGSNIQIVFRVGGGQRGRIGVGQIDTVRQLTPLPPANAATSVRFRNVTPSSGGTDKESLSQAKKRAPKDYALQRSIVSAPDYAQAASSFIHPVFGAVSKAIATVNTSINANTVEFFILAEGPDGLPTAPSAGLKAGLITFMSDLNVLTDNLVVSDGKTKAVDIELNVMIDRNADASVVRQRVESAITDFFNISNWEMGEAFYTSNFIDTVEAVDGVAYVDLFSPYDNITPTGSSASPDSTGIGYNEIIIEGKRKTNYYYEKAPPPGGIRTAK